MLLNCHIDKFLPVKSQASLFFSFFFGSNLILSAQLDTRGYNDFTDYGI